MADGTPSLGGVAFGSSSFTSGPPAGIGRDRLSDVVSELKNLRTDFVTGIRQLSTDVTTGMRGAQTGFRQAILPITSPRVPTENLQSLTPRQQTTYSRSLIGSMAASAFPESLGNRPQWMSVPEYRTAIRSDLGVQMSERGMGAMAEGIGVFAPSMAGWAGFGMASGFIGGMAMAGGVGIAAGLAARPIYQDLKRGIRYRNMLRSMGPRLVRGTAFSSGIGGEGLSEGQTRAMAQQVRTMEDAPGYFREGQGMEFMAVASRVGLMGNLRSPEEAMARVKKYEPIIERISKAFKATIEDSTKILKQFVDMTPNPEQAIRDISDLQTTYGISPNQIMGGMGQGMSYARQMGADVGFGATFGGAITGSISPLIKSGMLPKGLVKNLGGTPGILQETQNALFGTLASEEWIMATHRYDKGTGRIVRDPKRAARLGAGGDLGAQGEFQGSAGFYEGMTVDERNEASRALRADKWNIQQKLAEDPEYMYEMVGNIGAMARRTAERTNRSVGEVLQDYYGYSPEGAEVFRVMEREMPGQRSAARSRQKKADMDIRATRLKERALFGGEKAFTHRIAAAYRLGNVGIDDVSTFQGNIKEWAGESIQNRFAYEIGLNSRQPAGDFDIAGTFNRITKDFSPDEISAFEADLSKTRGRSMNMYQYMAEWNENLKLPFWSQENAPIGINLKRKTVGEAFKDYYEKTGEEVGGRAEAMLRKAAGRGYLPDMAESVSTALRDPASHLGQLSALQKLSGAVSQYGPNSDEAKEIYRQSGGTVGDDLWSSRTGDTFEEIGKMAAGQYEIGRAKGAENMIKASQKSTEEYLTRKTLTGRLWGRIVGSVWDEGPGVHRWQRWSSRMDDVGGGKFTAAQTRLYRAKESKTLDEQYKNLSMMMVSLAQSSDTSDAFGKALEDIGIGSEEGGGIYKSGYGDAQKIYALIEKSKGVSGEKAAGYIEEARQLAKQQIYDRRLGMKGETDDARTELTNIPGVGDTPTSKLYEALNMQIETNKAIYHELSGKQFQHSAETSTAIDWTAQEGEQTGSTGKPSDKGKGGGVGPVRWAWRQLPFVN